MGTRRRTSRQGTSETEHSGKRERDDNETATSKPGPTAEDSTMDDMGRSLVMEEELQRAIPHDAER